MTYTLQQFGQKIKEKYPSMRNMSDEAVAQKILEIYPQYKSQVQGYAPEDTTPDVSQFSDPNTAKKALVTDPVGSSLTLAQVISNPSKVAAKFWENLMAAPGAIYGSKSPIIGKAAENLKKGLGQLGATATGISGEAYSEVGNLAGSVVGLVSKKGGEAIKQAGQTIKQNIESLAPEGTEGFQKAGEFITDVAGITVPIAGMATKVKSIPAAVSAISKFPTLSKILGFTAASTGATELMTIEKEGRTATLPEIGWGIALDAALLGGGKLIKSLLGSTKYTSSAVKSLKEQAKSAGISPGNIKAISDLDDETKKIAFELYDQAKKSIEDNIEMTPLEVASKYVDGFQKEITHKLSEVGKLIGKEKGGLSKEIDIDISPVYKSFVDFIESKGVSVAQDGTLNFSKSAFKGISGDEKVIKNVFDLVQNQAVSPFDLKNVIENINGLLYVGASQADLAASEAGAELVRKSLREVLEGVGGNIGKYMKQYSDLSEIATLLTKKVKVEGMKSPQLLSSLFGAARKETRTLLDQISNIAKEFDFKNGKNLLAVANLTKTIEDAFKIIGERSLAGGVKSGTLALSGKQTATNIINQALGGLMENLQKTQPELIQQILQGGNIDQSLLQQILPPEFTDAILKAIRAQLNAEETLTESADAVNPF